MSHDDAIVVSTAAMPDGTGVDKALEQFPNRAWDTGICESHALDMMAGMAKTGCKPFFAVYSTFLQRAFDQAFQEVALQGLPVRFCIDRAGVVGGDGSVHHGFCDIALLRLMPEAALMAAIDEKSLRAAMQYMSEYNCGLSAVRYPRDSVHDIKGNCPPFELGKARPLNACEEMKLAILAYGTTAIDALEAADRVDANHIAVFDARFAKPVDGDLIQSILEQDIPIMTVEDHSIIGGFGAAVLEEAVNRKLDASRITRLALPDRWIGHGARSEQLAEAGIDARGIAATATTILHSNQTPAPETPTPAEVIT
jgi:1-deoxy-D-xylulose-5-phosphate synthase